MLVNVQSSKSRDNCGVQAVLKEKPVDRSISDYIIENYDNLVKYIRRTLGITYDKANDLLHDVYVNAVQSENNGVEIYDEIDIASGKVFEITTSQLVYRRLKLYSKAPKYHNETCETGRTKILTRETGLVSDISVDEEGNVEYRNKRGRLVMKPMDIQVVPTYSRPDGDADSENEMDKFQACYTYAASFDDLDSIVEYASLRDEIDFCVDVCSLHGYDIMRILKKIDSLSKMISDKVDKNELKSFSRTAFSTLRNIIDNNDELEESLMDILLFASKNRDAYDMLISTY